MPNSRAKKSVLLPSTEVGTFKLKYCKTISVILCSVAHVCVEENLRKCELHYT